MANLSLYASVQDIRDLTGLTSDQISDSLISGIISHSVTQLNADIQTKWKDERVAYISNEKQNKQNSENTRFYVNHFPIGDRDNNGVISGADVYAYTVDSQGTKAQIVVSGVTAAGDELGSVAGGPIYLTTAPANNVTLYFTYYSSPVDMETPHPLVKLACTQLAAALCYTRIDVGKVQSFRVGKVAVMRQSEAYKIYSDQYYDTINRIRQEFFKTAKSSEYL